MNLKRLLQRRVSAPAPVLNSLDAYAKWAADYPPHAHNALMRAEEAAVLRMLPPLDGLAVLDLAGGTGRYGLIAEKRGAGRVITLDNSADMLRANPLQRRVRATTEALPLPTGALDGVICALALGHLSELSPSIREIARVLRVGGWAIISDVHPFIALKGGQRTFKTDGQTFAVEHYVHLVSDYTREARMAGLEIVQIEEPRLQPEDAQGMPTAGAPIVIVYHLRKLDSGRTG